MKKYADKLKRIIKNPRIFPLYFLDKGILNWISDEKYLALRYRIITGRKLNIKNPRTFSEKLQWLKLNDRNPDYTKMVDKCAAKEYVASLIGSDYIIPTLGVWERFEDIDFNTLPNQFVLKCNHNSGGVCVCRDKAKLDKKKLCKKMTSQLKTNFFYPSRQQSYKNIKPQLIAEQYLEDANDKGKSKKGLVDYKFYCFHGEPKFLYLSQGLEDHKTAFISYVTLDWKKADFHRTDYKEFKELPEKPAHFEKMIEFARILSRGHYFLRVDFYEVNEKIYFGELTFYPGNGMTSFEPFEYECKFGEMIKLPM